MDEATRELVRRRASDSCEYCQLRQEHSALTHHVEHIVARKHGGGGGLDNLALACHRCNLCKGPNLTGIDPATGRIASLYNPRLQSWDEHFRWDGLRIEKLTPTGRATVRVLSMNDSRRLELREEINAQLPPD